MKCITCGQELISDRLKALDKADEEVLFLRKELSMARAQINAWKGAWAAVKEELDRIQEKKE